MTKYVNGKPLPPPPTLKHGVPIPPSRKGKNADLYEVVLGMAVGDCFDIPYSRTGVASNLSRATGYTLVQRKVGDILRVWRTA